MLNHIANVEKKLYVYFYSKTKAIGDKYLHEFTYHQISTETELKPDLQVTATNDPGRAVRRRKRIHSE